MSDAPASLFFGGNLPVGHIKLILQPSSGIHTDRDASVWLASGAVVPAAQADSSLIDTDLRCVKANLDVNLPVTLTAAARFAVSSSVTWIIDAAGAVIYSTDGTTWGNTTPSGGGAITFFIGYRNTGSGVEVFAGSSTQLYRAVITNAAPSTVAWSAVATISSTTYFGGASYAFDGTTHLMCFPSTSGGNIVALTSSDGVTWSENTRPALDAANEYKCLVAAKPGGGFRVAVGLLASGGCMNVYATTVGVTFTKQNTSTVNIYAVMSGNGMLVYVGSRLFFFRHKSAQSYGGEILYSDDDGVTWAGFHGLYAAATLGVYGSGGASWDGTTLAFVGYNSAAGAYLISTTDGNTFKCTQLFMSASEIASLSVGHVKGSTFLFIPHLSTKNKLFRIQNSFTPNASTDFVGLANRNVPYVSSGPNNFVYAARIK